MNELYIYHYVYFSRQELQTLREVLKKQIFYVQAATFLHIYWVTVETLHLCHVDKGFPTDTPSPRSVWVAVQHLERSNKYFVYSDHLTLSLSGFCLLPPTVMVLPWWLTWRSLIFSDILSCSQIFLVVLT